MRLNKLNHSLMLLLKGRGEKGGCKVPGAELWAAPGASAAWDAPDRVVGQWGIAQSALCAGQTMALVSELRPVSNNDGKGEDEEEKGWGRDVTHPVQRSNLGQPSALTS